MAPQTKLKKIYLDHLEKINFEVLVIAVRLDKYTFFKKEFYKLNNEFNV